MFSYNLGISHGMLLWFICHSAPAYIGNLWNRRCADRECKIQIAKSTASNIQTFSTKCNHNKKYELELFSTVTPYSQKYSTFIEHLITVLYGTGLLRSRTCSYFSRHCTCTEQSSPKTTCPDEAVTSFPQPCNILNRTMTCSYLSER